METYKDRKAHKIIKTSIGDIAIYGLTVGEEINIEEDLKSGIKDAGSDKYILAFTKYSCHKIESLDKTKFKPKNSTLLDDELKQLTSDNLEEIAKEYLKHSEFLYKKSSLESKKNKKGDDRLTVEYGEVEIPKKDNESYREYLYNLKVKQVEKLEKSFEKSFGYLSSFSRQTQKKIQRTLTLGEHLSKSIKATQSLNIPKVLPIISEPKPDLDNINLQMEENRLKSFKDLSEKMDELIQTNSESIQFMIEANKLQTRIADEIKGSSDTSSQLSKKNIYISLIVLLIGVLSFCYSIYSVYNSNISNDGYTKEIIKELKEINKNVRLDDSFIKSTEEKMFIFSMQLDSTLNINHQLNEEIKSVRKNN
jgi:hypothetical protein